MKKIIAISILCGCLSANAFAQLGKLNFDIGLKIGANLNKVEGRYWDNGYKANFLAGLYAGVHSRRWGVQIEPLYTQSTFATGTGFNDLYKDFYQAGKDSVTGGKFKVNYLNVPVLLNVKMFSKVWLQVGPQFSGTLSVNDPDGLMDDAESFLKNSMISGVFGLWINLPSHITLSGRYIIGLNNLNGNSNYIQYNKHIEDNWKQKLLQIGIGYTFF